jgi:hypothetical protein
MGGSATDVSVVGSAASEGNSNGRRALLHLSLWHDRFLRLRRPKTRRGCSAHYARRAGSSGCRSLATSSKTAAAVSSSIPPLLGSRPKATSSSRARPSSWESSFPRRVAKGHPVCDDPSSFISSSVRATISSLLPATRRAQTSHELHLHKAGYCGTESNLANTQRHRRTSDQSLNCTGLDGRLWLTDVVKNIREAFAQAGRDQPAEYPSLPAWEALSQELRAPRRHPRRACGRDKGGGLAGRCVK